MSAKFMEIRKKIWPEWFDKIKEGKKTVDLRLADFDIKEGDILVLEEWDPDKKKYTGRILRKKVSNLSKVQLLDFHPVEEIEKFGHWVIEFE